MAISVDGIVSGIDTTAIVDKLVAAATIPKNVMETHMTALTAKKEAYAGLSSRMDDLKTALEKMDTIGELAAATGTSADETIVGVATTGAAVKGRYAITVTQLAAATTNVSDGVADKDAIGSVATGTMSITVGTTTTAVTIDATNSNLADLASSINETVDGVTAYVMDTGDATAPYRLVIVGNDTGAANAVTVDTTGMDATTGTVPTFSETTTAADAQLTVNGVAVTSPDNVVDTVVSGVTFTLNDVTSTSPVNVNVAADTDTMVATFQAFVDSYNAVMSHVRSNRAFDQDKSIKGPFVGEGAVSSLMAKMQAVLSKQYTTGSSLHALGGMGFSTQQNGDIELDVDELTAALAAHPDDVLELFTDDTDGVGAGMVAYIDSVITEDEEVLANGSSEHVGIIALRNDALDTAVSELERDIENFEDRMIKYEERLRAQFTAMEIALGRLQASGSALTAFFESNNSSKK